VRGLLIYCSDYRCSHSTMVSAVARRAGAGKPATYRWWPTKAALLLDVNGRYKLERPIPTPVRLAFDVDSHTINATRLTCTNSWNMHG
jgi:hypothetical protein